MDNEIKFTPTKPRSMVRVMSDIEYCIINDFDKDIIKTDIEQLKTQLSNLQQKLDDREKAYKLINPAINYYD